MTPKGGATFQFFSFANEGAYLLLANQRLSLRNTAPILFRTSTISLRLKVIVEYNLISIMAFITPKLTDLVVAMQKNYTCSICLEILTYPIVTKCNHQFCKDCSQHLLKQPPPVSCPLCKTRLTKRSFSENPFGGEVAKAVQQVMAAIKTDAPHAKISPPKGPRGPNEFDDPASQRSEVIFIPETVTGKSKLSRKRGRNKESDIIQESKRPNLQNPITVYTDKNKEPSVTVKIVPITNTNIRSGFPSTRSKKSEMAYDKPYLKSSKPVDVGIGKSIEKESAITDCQIVAETCPFIEENVVEVEKEVVIKKEVAVKMDRDNFGDIEDDVLVSVSQVSPQEFQPSRAMTSRMLSMVTGQTQSPRTKVASWLQKSVDEKDGDQPEAISTVQTPKANDVKLTQKPKVEGKLLSDPYEFVSSQRGTPHCTAKVTRKRKQQPKRNYAARTRKPFHRTDTAIQSLSTKYIDNARNLRNRNQSSSSQFYSALRIKSSPPPLKQKPKLDHDVSGNLHEVQSLDSPTQDAFDILVVEHNKTVSEHVDMPKIEEEEEEFDDYALFVTPRCPPRKELKPLCPPHNQKSKTPAKKAPLTRCRGRKISELEDIVAELDEVSRFTLNISGKQNEPKANVTPAVKAEEKAENEIVPKVEQDRKLTDRNTKPTVLPKGPFLKRKKGSSDERRSGFGFFTAEDEIVDITVSQSDDEIPSKGKASARKESISPKKKGSTSSEVEWRRISQLNRDFYSKRRKSSGDENAQNTHNANADKRDIKSPEEAAGKSGLAQNPSQRSTKSCNLIGLDKDDNLIEVSHPDNNLPDIDLQNIATTSAADNVVITDAKRHTSGESIEVPYKTPPGKARSLDADKHDLPVITDKRLEAKDEARNTESAKPFKCPFTIRGKLEVTPLDVSQYLCSKCQSHVICEEVAVPEDKVEEETSMEEPPQTTLKVSDSETDDEDQAVLLTRSSISYEPPNHDDDQNALSSARPTSPLSAVLPSETQRNQIKPNVTGQVELPNVSQPPMPRNTPTELSQIKATPCGEIRSQSSVKTKEYDKLEVKKNSQKSTATQEDLLHFDTWNSWLSDNGERTQKPQDSFEDHNDKENQQNVAIFMKDEGHVPQTPPQHCVPKALAAAQRSTPPRAALSAQSPKSNHVAEKEKCQRVPERKYCRIKAPVDSDTDSSQERDEAPKSCHLETKRLEDKEWSHYLKMKYCNKSDGQSWKVTHDPPSGVISAKKPVESAATPPIVIDLETEDDCSQSGESLFGSQNDIVTTRSQNMRNTITNIRKDLEMAGLSYPTQQASQISQGVSQKKQLPQSSESNPRGEDKKDKDEEQEDWALSAGVNVTTDRNPAARQGASASSRGAGDDGSSIFLFEREEDDLEDDRLSGIVPSQTVPYNTQAQMQLQDQVESLQQKIQRLEAQLKAKK